MKLNTDIIHLDFQGETIFLKRKYIDADAPVILYLHGLKYSTDALWDLAIDGASAMDHLAQEGFDVWAFDFIGLGKSSRPEVINGNLDFVLDTIKCVISFIHTKNANKMNIIGWSAGCTWALALAQTEKIEKMILVSPRTPSTQKLTPRLASETYRFISPELVINNWLGKFEKAQRNRIVNDKTVECYKTALLNSDIIADKFRVPMYLQNLMEMYSSGEQSFYDIKKINSPIGIICGELDSQAQDSQNLFDQCDTPKKLKYVKDATHWLIIENNRFEFINFCKNFLV